jgi:Nsp1-like C-terminal region
MCTVYVLACVRKQIITEWNQKLEADVGAFTNQAVKVADWDRRLRDSQRGLTTLADQVSVLYVFAFICTLSYRIQPVEYYCPTDIQ